MKHRDSLSIKNLHVNAADKEILRGVTLTIGSGEVHAIMGPNGSGKSTLAYAVMGHPGFTVRGELVIGKKNILDLPSEDRARSGLFLAFQSPIAVPGVSVINLLRTSYQSIHRDGVPKKVHTSVQNPVLARRFQGSSIDMVSFMKTIKEYAAVLKLDDSLLSRGVHDGFSGGEKKKLEMLQALVLAPKFAVFDEIDTGLDVDALRLVGLGIERLAKNGTGVIVITHYQRILRYMNPSAVHVLVKGKIVKTGNAGLVKDIEENGYKKYT